LCFSVVEQLAVYAGPLENGALGLGAGIAKLSGGGEDEEWIGFRLG
jgi:hypothetical protein